MTEVFDITKKPVKRTYIVKDFLALGAMAGLYSQAGSGKTYVGLGLAVCVAYGKPFLGLETKQMKVLYIDQDEAEDDTKERLHQFISYYKIKKSSSNLLLSCMNDLQLYNGTLAKAIVDSKANLAIIDSLTTVTRELTREHGSDMAKLKELYQTCVNSKTTLLIIHHISEHKLLAPDEMMICNPADLAMYSSVINQTVDGYYLLINPHKGTHAKELYLRPVVKRYPIRTGTLKFGLEQTPETLHLSDAEKIEFDSSDYLTPEERFVLQHFVETGKELYVKDMILELKDLLGQDKVRTRLASLANKGFLYLTVEGTNKYRYGLTERGKEYGGGLPEKAKK